jgi:hypothetical protein
MHGQRPFAVGPMVWSATSRIGRGHTDGWQNAGRLLPVQRLPRQGAVAYSHSQVAPRYPSVERQQEGYERPSAVPYAWRDVQERLAHRIREARIDAKPEPLGRKGKSVQADETYYGNTSKREKG